MDREGAIKKDGKRQIGSRGTQTHTQFALVPLFSFAAAAHTLNHFQLAERKEGEEVVCPIDSSKHTSTITTPFPLPSSTFD